MASLLAIVRPSSCRLASRSAAPARRCFTTSLAYKSQANGEPTAQEAQTNETAVSPTTSQTIAEVTERLKIAQAPNREETWSKSQQPRDLAMTGPRFEQTFLETQPQPYAAIELIHKQPVRWVDGRKVSCDGGGGPHGHPRIFINLDKPKINWCTYCGLPYANTHHRKHIEAQSSHSYPLQATPDPGRAQLPETLSLHAQSRGSYLITDHIVSQLPELRTYKVGLLHLFVQHTSCALSLNENWDPDVRVDMSDALDRIVPEEGTRTGNSKAPVVEYNHSCEGPDDMPAHVKSALVGASVSIPIKDGKLLTGTWQGIWYLEFRARRHTRTVVATIQGETWQVCQQMMALKEQCVHPRSAKPYITSLTGGLDNSAEGYQFGSREDRDYYVDHDPAHAAFKQLADKVVDKVQVIDYAPGVFYQEGLTGDSELEVD
ncbi:hypothetical protein DV735_g1851, partial [Chaetothyriales sp. CBS 134920]